jgi:glycosyltransferase involved in cell wall biosynthesis
MTTAFEISVCIPAYGRVNEFKVLLSSLLEQTCMPFEIVVCEDCSPQREALREIAAQWMPLFSAKGCSLRFEENARNLGYDGNLRHLIHLARGRYVFFIGNDDVVLSHGIEIAQRFLSTHSVHAASRSFERFDTDPRTPIGVSRALELDTVISRHSHDASWVMRIGGFFGGLVFQRDWAHQLATSRYDGSLYYQIYLLLHAYANGSIGYMAEPTVGARADNAPLFGNAAAEKGSFQPGRYTVAARKKMWQSILAITKETELETGVPMLDAIRRELAGRMSFHVFEMFAGRPKEENRDLRRALIELGLYDDKLPKLFFALNMSLGRYAALPYRMARLLLQR